MFSPQAGLCTVPKGVVHLGRSVKAALEAVQPDGFSFLNTLVLKVRAEQVHSKAGCISLSLGNFLLRKTEALDKKVRGTCGGLSREH